MPKTAFWQKAARGLHPSIRERHIREIQRAENFELALEAAIEGWSRARDALGRLFHATPRRPSHGHR